MKNRMNCAKWEIEISASLDGELSEKERAALDSHLKGCAACRETMASMTSLRRLAQNKIAEVRLEEQFVSNWSAIRPKLPFDAVRPPVFSRWAKLAACLLIGLFAAFSWSLRNSKPPAAIEQTQANPGGSMNAPPDFHAEHEERLAAALVTSLLVGQSGAPIETLLNGFPAMQTESSLLQ